jgi:1,4-dihydroxy-2-naphthoate octaprenyltransferase
MSDNKIKAWITAARPHTLSASLAPVIIASALAYRNGVFQIVPALLCACVALFAQIASNLANDYFDFKKGTDTEKRVGQPRAVASGWIKPETMLIATLIVLVITCICGLVLLFLSHWWLIFAGIAIILGVLAYSGGPYPLAYHGLGDVCVILFYGVIPLCLTYFVQADSIPPTAFLLSLSVGFLSINILVVNNYRDYEQDKEAGKRTLIVLLGKKFGKYFYLTNALLAIAFSYPVYLYRDKGIWFMMMVFLFLQLFTWQDMTRLKGRDLNRILEQTSRNLLIFALFLVSLLVF